MGRKYCGCYQIGSYTNTDVDGNLGSTGSRGGREDGGGVG